MQVNEEKRKKFMEYAGKRVNNVLHDIQILEPMSRSASYDFTRQDVEEMFSAMQETLNNAKAEFEKKFEEKARSEKKIFSFGNSIASTSTETVIAENYADATSTSTIDASTIDTIAETNLENTNDIENYSEIATTAETATEVF